MSLLLSSIFDIIYFDTDCLVILYNNLFFQVQVTNILIWKIVMPIIIQDFKANKRAID